MEYVTSIDNILLRLFDGISTIHGDTAFHRRSRCILGSSHHDNGGSLRSNRLALDWRGLLPIHLGFELPLLLARRRLFLLSSGCCVAYWKS